MYFQSKNTFEKYKKKNKIINNMVQLTFHKKIY
jgi:hypothetical protein